MIEIALWILDIIAAALYIIGAALLIALLIALIIVAGVVALSASADSHCHNPKPPDIRRPPPSPDPPA